MEIEESSSANQKPTKFRFQYEDDDQDETLEDNSTLELDEPDLLPKPIDTDKTSADYYFDSYSHFGIHEVSPCSGFKELRFNA